MQADEDPDPDPQRAALVELKIALENASFLQALSENALKNPATVYKEMISFQSQGGDLSIINVRLPSSRLCQFFI